MFPKSSVTNEGSKSVDGRYFEFRKIRIKIADNVTMENTDRTCMKKN